MIWALVAFLPFVMEQFHINMAVISWPNWPGYVTGTEFTVIDAFTLSLYFALPRIRQSLPFRISFALYFFATLLSALVAFVPMAVIFYCWQLARMCLVYVVVVSACADPGALSALLKGMSAGVVLRWPSCFGNDLDWACTKRPAPSSIRTHLAWLRTSLSSRSLRYCFQDA